ncbi:hypothetical protein GJ654_10340 [Rhodoblastus acidophilus]|uniref:Phage protein (N4 Gp49/phage Sf6 gene 66) family protein n=2 Tax=Rhodoblastus acidophilus TaxID=1074 RepID=A0A6N8DLC1_RHOAC|nr:hypothetical protein [Rhodoblastus acidophilus]
MEQPTKYDEAACEAEIIAKGKTSPRVTPDQIDAIIVTADYFQLRTLTICVITLWNGFTVTGESACASPDNYDAEIGKKLAFAQAREKIWALEGYRLKSLLAHEDESTADPNKAVKSDGAWVSIGIARLLERAKKAGVAEPKRQDLFHAAQALCVAIAKVGE